jgi:glycosyltransferase involved in cell wall biosynthesis
MEYFSPGTKSNRANIVFTGSMDWLPNDDAIQWFTSEVLPLVRGSVPDISLTIVGRNPSASLRAICDRDPAVVVTGRVPDVRPYMDDASVYVVPIRIGGGTRLKIYEAMAMELPVVSTTVGAEGLPVEDGREILLRDDAGSFAEAIVKLLNDPAAARKLGSQAANSVRENYGWAKVADDFATVCERTIQSRTRRMDKVQTVEDEGAAMRSEVA